MPIVGTPTTNTSSAGTSLSITRAGVTAGNTLIFAVGYNDTSGGAGPPATATDTNGTVSVALKPAAQTAGAVSCGVAIFFVPNCNSGSHTFAMGSIGGGGTLYSGGAVIEWSGLTNTPLDQTAGPGTSQGASTTTGNTGTSAALSQATELVVAVLAIASGAGQANAAISTASSGYTSVLTLNNTSTGPGVQISYKEPNSTAGQIATWTWSVGSPDATQLSTEQGLATFLETIPPFVSFLPLLGVG
jgi:hypothetical protein